MDANIGVFRTENGINNGIKNIKALQERYKKITIEDKSKVFNLELEWALEVGFMLDLAEVIAKGAVLRKESRGGHYRKDYPERDDTNFLKHTMATYSTEGPKFTYIPVNITKWKPAPRVY